mgnify:CR=1 FL=1|jgi:hypothetical protein
MNEKRVEVVEIVYVQAKNRKIYKKKGLPY